MDERRILVTGGAGFIGSAVIRLLVGKGYHVINVDKLTYSGDLTSVRDVELSPNHRFYRADICDQPAIARILEQERPHGVMHLAAETHVDRSIDGPAEFVEANVVGTVRLLDVALGFWRGLGEEARREFRFHHISTDEVYGELDLEGGVFNEETPYAPSSPYSASKAAADHFARAWHTTYGFPVIVSNCSNNYGPYQFPEKLVPLTILNAIDELGLPVYGKGENVRDWLYVEDHARALELIFNLGHEGEGYNVGGRAERSNLSVVQAICDLLDRKRPRTGNASHRELIRFVTDRPGHDLRYAIDPSKIERELGWRAQEDFESGIEKTVDWFLENEWWWRPIRDRKYSGQRLGTGA